MGVSENSGTPKSSILIGFSILNHPLWGTPIFGSTHIWMTIPFLNAYVSKFPTHPKKSYSMKFTFLVGNSMGAGGKRT